MQKLVLKSPILRFKEGRKIVKALGGLPMVINNQGGVPATRTIVGGVPATRPTTGGVPSVVSKATKVGRGLLGRAGSFLGRAAGPLGALLLGLDVEKQREEVANKLNSGEYTFSDGKLVKNEAASGVNVGNTVSSAVNRLTAIDKLLKTGNYILDKNGNLVKKSSNSTNSKVSNRASIPRRPLKTKEQWESLFNDAKNQLSAQQLMYLDSLGIDISSAEKMQQGINAYNKNSELVVDNKWGDKSSTALSKILSSMPSDYRNKDTLLGLDNEKNIPDVVPTKPVVPQVATNFGYRTNNTYENSDFSDRLKNMGIRSNADLIDFGWRTLGNDYDWKGDNWAKQFRSDINLALGGDWSDVNIRKTFNTSGNWGRGFLGRGDVGDLQNALLTNAGTWNGLYDKNKANYDNQRTGNNGIVYSTPRLKELFDKVIVNPSLNLTNYGELGRQFLLSQSPYTYALFGIKQPGYMPYYDYFKYKYKQGGQLVSKNSILRFKLGKKIVKAQFGYRTRNDGVIVNAAGTPVGRSIRESSYEYEKGFPGDKLILNGLYLDASTGDIFSPNKKNGEGEYIKVLSKPSPIQNGTYYETKDTSGKVIERGRYFGGTKHSLPIGKNSNKSKPQKQQSSTAKSSTTVKSKPRSGWSYGYNRSNEISDIKATQQMLKDAGYLSSDKYNVVDGKWGSDTENAYKLYLALKDVPTYERTPEQTVDISSPSKVLNSTIVNLEPVTTDLIITNNNIPTVENEGGLKYFSRNGNYNRSLVRDYMRSMGLNPYNFTGGLRRALRHFLNNEGKGGEYIGKRLYDLFVKPYGYKQGGQLISRNPVERFKNKIK